MMISAPKNNSNVKLPTLFTATPTVSTIPKDFDREFDDGFGSFGKSYGSAIDKEGRYHSPFSRPRSNNSTYNVKRNDDDVFQAEVPLGVEFSNKPDAVKVVMSGNTVTITAKIETVDVNGAKRMSKVYKDVTLPSDCDLKTMEANIYGENMVISAKKGRKPTDSFVPIRDRQMHENRGDDTPWKMGGAFAEAKDRTFGNVTSSFLNDTLAEMEKNRADFVRPQNKGMETARDKFVPGQNFQTLSPQPEPRRSKDEPRRSTGKTVRFSDVPSSSSPKPDKEPETKSTFTINVDHEHENNEAKNSTKKGVGKVDVDDFIMAEVDAKPESQAEKLEQSMKKLHLELLSEERPSSIPPNEPFEDLGLVEG